MFRRRPAPLRTFLAAFALATTAAAGWAVAAYAASGSADGLLPTVTVPTLPVSVPTLPVSVPTISLPLGGTTTTTAATTTTSTVPQTTTATTTVVAPAGSTTETTGTGAAPTQTPTTVADPPADTDVSAGVIRLANGEASIPVSSVSGAARLVVTKVSLTPRTIRAKRAHLVLVLRVRDSRGYLVRGAVVRITSKPLSALAGTPGRKTGTTGLVRFVLVTTNRLVLKPHTAMTITARALGSGTAARVATATLAARVPIDPPRTHAAHAKR